MTSSPWTLPIDDVSAHLQRTGARPSRAKVPKPYLPYWKQHRIADLESTPSPTPSSFSASWPSSPTTPTSPISPTSPTSSSSSSSCSALPLEVETHPVPAPHTETPLQSFPAPYPSPSPAPAPWLLPLRLASKATRARPSSRIAFATTTAFDSTPSVTGIAHDARPPRSTVPATITCHERDRGGGGGC